MRLSYLDCVAQEGPPPPSARVTRGTSPKVQMLASSLPPPPANIHHAGGISVASPFLRMAECCLNPSCALNCSLIFASKIYD